MALLRFFSRLMRPTTRNMGQLGAKVLSRSCYCWRRAPSCTHRSADMSIEALVIRLSRRQGPAACLWRLLRPTTCILCLVCRGSRNLRGTTSPTTEGARLTRHLPGMGFFYTHSGSFSTQIVVLCNSVHPTSKRGVLVHLLTK